MPTQNLSGYPLCIRSQKTAISTVKALACAASLVAAKQTKHSRKSNCKNIPSFPRFKECLMFSQALSASLRPLYGSHASVKKLSPSARNPKKHLSIGNLQTAGTNGNLNTGPQKQKRMKTFRQTLLHTLICM